MNKPEDMTLWVTFEGKDFYTKDEKTFYHEDGSSDDQSKRASKAYQEILIKQNNDSRRS